MAPLLLPGTGLGIGDTADLMRKDRNRRPAFAGYTQPGSDLSDAPRGRPLGTCGCASALRRSPVAALPGRQYRADRRELRGLDLLRAAAPEFVDRARVVLPVHGRRLLPRAAVVGAQLDHLDVPPRQLGSHP